MGSKGNYTNLSNSLDFDKDGVWRSVLELLCMGSVDLVFFFSQKINHCVISEQDGCSFCYL